MKIKDGFVLREVAGEYMVIAAGDASREFYGYIRLNGTGRDIWEGIEKGLTAEEIAAGLAEKYKVDIEKAAADTEKMIASMEQEGILEA